MKPVVEEQMAESFLIGGLLAICGGFLDTYTYISRGKVFANAQTGNIVLLGLQFAEGNFKRGMMYLVPILAFIAGVLLTEWIRARIGGFLCQYVHWKQVIIIIEIFVLMLVGLLPDGVLDAAVHVAVSFVCAMQVESFRKLEGNAFASTMCTGNLRSAAEQFFYFFHMKDKNALRKGLQYSGIIAVFIVGAMIGVFITKAFHAKAVFFCCFDLLVVFCLQFITNKKRRKRNEGMYEI